MIERFKKIISTARQLKVAYLIDLDDCPHELLNAIFAECYGRWGGRRTLIIPTTTKNGIDPAFSILLKAYDPDIIYGYLELEDDIIQKINEEYCPLYLLNHQKPKSMPKSDPYFYIPNLPIQGLTALSFYPYLLKSKGMIDYAKIKIMDCSAWYKTQISGFISDNFGVPLLSNLSSILDSFPNLFQSFRIATQEYLDNSKLIKPTNCEMTTDYSQFIKRISDQNDIISLSTLSDIFSFKIDFYSHTKFKHFNLVIGNKPQDRILFWNLIQHQSRITNEISSLILDPEQVNDDFIETIRDVIYRPSPEHVIMLCSFSQTENELENYKLVLESKLRSTRVEISKINSFYDVFPKEQTNYNIIDHQNFDTFRNDSNSNSNFFIVNQIEIQNITPAFLTAIDVPSKLKEGEWMIDLSIERHNNNSRYTNINHFWKFPRRLRIDKFFEITNYGISNKQKANIKRINFNHDISISTQQHVNNILINVPDDSDIIINSITSDYDWEPYKRQNTSKPFTSHKRYDKAILSDKGRYFLGVLNHFNSLWEVEQFMLHKFWIKIFERLGATNKYLDEGSVKQLSNYIKKITPNSSSTLNEINFDKISEKALKVCLKIKKSKRYISWNKIMEFWEEFHQDYIKHANFYEPLTERDTKEYAKNVEKSTQLLCQHKILFQGYDWTCNNCLHKNWTSIQNLNTNTVCEICDSKKAAPISDDWKFHLNDFIFESFRNQGVLALIWALIKIYKRAKICFYFSPSLRFLNDANEILAESDLMGIVDGDLYVCEIKSSSRISKEEYDKFIKVVNVLRPNTAILAIMENLADISDIESQIKTKLDDGIKLEILTFDDSDLEDSSLLPNNQISCIRLF